VTRRLQSIQLASAELEAAVRWYEERRRGLGAEFFDAVSLTMALIAERPEIGTVIDGRVSLRRIVVSRFPYQVVYRVTPADITIVAVAHLKRRPNYWKDRHSSP
jgi:plasmid stabilization system protein ParE